MSDWLKEILQTAFRMAPWPTEPGLRAEMGKTGRAMVARRFDLSVLSARLVEHYQRLQTASAGDSALSMDAR